MHSRSRGVVVAVAGLLVTSIVGYLCFAVFLRVPQQAVTEHGALPHGSEQQTAVEKFVRFNYDEVVNGLTEVVRVSDDERADGGRALAAQLLGRLGARRGVPALVRHLDARNAEPISQEHVANAIEDYPCAAALIAMGPSARDAFLHELQGPSWLEMNSAVDTYAWRRVWSERDVELAAIVLLALCGDDRALAVQLVRGTESKAMNKDVFQRLPDALGRVDKVNGPEGFRFLAVPKPFEAPTAEVPLIAALESLRRSGPEASEERLAAAASIMSEYNRAIEDLTQELLEDDKPHFEIRRMRAARQLGRIMALRAIPALLEQLTVKGSYSHEDLRPFCLAEYPMVAAIAEMGRSALEPFLNALQQREGPLCEEEKLILAFLVNEICEGSRSEAATVLQATANRFNNQGNVRSLYQFLPVMDDAARRRRGHVAEPSM